MEDKEPLMILDDPIMSISSKDEWLQYYKAILKKRIKAKTPMNIS